MPSAVYYLDEHMPLRDEVVDWLESARADLAHAKKSIEMGDYS